MPRSFRFADLATEVGLDVNVRIQQAARYHVLFRRRYQRDELRALVDELAAQVGARRVLLVTDDNVSPIISKGIAEDLRACSPEVRIISIPVGEEAKDVGQLVSLWARFKELGVERRDLLIGVGGGVVCDVVGFAAAVYLRGLPYMLIPTSLMAQVDAAVGGKVGVDFLGSKNWLGAFYHPIAVMGFVEHLGSLDDAEFANGFAEIVKVAFAAGGDLWTTVCRQDPASLRADGQALCDLVRASALAKLRLLEADPLELHSLNRPLNFGHCLGHAIESASHFSIRHGQAVALGMAMAARIGSARGVCERDTADTLLRVLQAFDLPTALAVELIEPSWRQVEDLRKVRNGLLRLVVPDEPGRVHFVDDISRREFIEAAGHV